MQYHSGVCGGGGGVFALLGMQSFRIGFILVLKVVVFQYI